MDKVFFLILNNDIPHVILALLPIAPSYFAPSYPLLQIILPPLIIELLSKKEQNEYLLP